MTLVLTRNERRALRRALSLLDLDRPRVALSVLTGATGLLCATALSAVAAWLITRAAQIPDVTALGVAPVMVRLFGVSRSVLRYCERLISHDTALRGMNALRTHLYTLLAASRTDAISALRRGDVLARVGADVDAVGDLIIRSFLPAAVAATVGLFTAVAMSMIYWPAGLILAACLLLAGVVGPLATIRSARLAEIARQEHATDLSATVLNAIDGGSELNVSGCMSYLLADLDTVESRLAATRDRAAKPAAIAAAIDTLAMGLAVLGAILVGVPAVEAGHLGQVWLAVIVLVPLSAFEATATLGPASIQLFTSAGAAVRIGQLLERADATTTTSSAANSLTQSTHTAAAVTETPVRPALHAVTAIQSSFAPCSHPTDAPLLSARNLAVGWPDRPIVADGINLSLTTGQRLAIVGPSGIGKTTLLLTLAGLLPPRGGELSLDGMSPWTMPRTQIAHHLTLTQEEAHIFDTSVLENLRVARGTIDAAQAHALLERAGLGQWLAALPHGLDTIISSDATTLSGGERRRLLLARALAAPAPLMLLDEPAEHLDTRTADRLVTDLLTADPHRGVLLVTHRLSALAHADEVIVLDHQPGAPASIRCRGTHADLSVSDEQYRWSLSQEEYCDV